MEVLIAMRFLAGHFPYWVLIFSSDNETINCPRISFSNKLPKFQLEHKCAKLKAIFSGFFVGRSGHKIAKLILQFLYHFLKMKLLNLDSPHSHWLGNDSWGHHFRPTWELHAEDGRACPQPGFLRGSTEQGSLTSSAPLSPKLLCARKVKMASLWTWVWVLLPQPSPHPS